jgi:hypothetical protein
MSPPEQDSSYRNLSAPLALGRPKISQAPFKRHAEDWIIPQVSTSRERLEALIQLAGSNAAEDALKPLLGCGVAAQLPQGA